MYVFCTMTKVVTVVQYINYVHISPFFFFSLPSLLYVNYFSYLSYRTSPFHQSKKNPLPENPPLPGDGERGAIKKLHKEGQLINGIGIGLSYFFYLKKMIQQTPPPPYDNPNPFHPSFCPLPPFPPPTNHTTYYDTNGVLLPGFWGGLFWFCI